MKTIYFRLFVIFITTIFSTVSICADQVQYVVTDLGTLGGNYSIAYGINDSGQVVGTAAISNTSYRYHAFLYANGIMSDLGAFSDFSDSVAIAINNNGQIVGYVRDPTVQHSDRAFLYSNGNMINIGTLYNIRGDTHASGINDSGQVAIGGGYLYSNGTITDLPGSGPGDPNVGPADINNSGTVVGSAKYFRGDLLFHYNIYTYSNGIVTNLGTPLGYSDINYSHPSAINNNGQIVGYVGGYGLSEHAFLYSNGTWQDLGSNIRANDINDEGQIVLSPASGNSAFLYSNGATQNLNALITPSSGWHLSSATAINNVGQIVGRGINPTRQSHAFLLTPVGKCQSYQVQPPVCAPVERLAKWDGTNWVSVNKGDLSSGNIHVLVHGWAPGLRTFADDGGKIWDENDPKTGDNTNKDFAEKLKNAATGIKAVAPGDIVIAFNWLDMSATETENLTTEPRKSRNNTDQAAADLVNALKSAGISAGVFDGKLQIIGVSHGARVSALATENLYKNGKSGSIVVDQLTLADSPEGITGLVGANNRLASVLNGIKIGRDASSTFVDNYYSYFGESYFADDDIVNVRLNPKPSLSIGDKHIYPINWYEGASKNTTTLGLAWSPLEGDTYKNLSSNYEQDWQNPDGSIDYSREYVLRDKDAGLTPTEKWLKLDMSTLLTQGLVTGIPGGMRLTEHSPAYWHTSFSKDANDIAIEFTYQFLDAGDGDQLTLWIDDELRFVITGDIAGADAFTTDIDISDLDPGYHILSVALNNYGDMNASVDVTDFTMVSVPEPSSLFLLVAGIIFFRKRK